MCEDYIQNKLISKENLELIQPYVEGLEEVKKSRELLRKARDSLVLKDSKETLSILRKADAFLIRLTQKMGTQLSEKYFMFLEKILASEISKINFLRSFILIGANKVSTALDTLDQTALFATIARLPETVLSINYLIALVYVFNSLYNKAIDQYNFIFKIAENYGQQSLKLKALIGESITRYLIGNKDNAFQLGKKITENVSEQDLPQLMNALIDSGDYFLAMGIPEIASNLYSEAMECAVDAQQEYKYNLLLNKMKYSFMATSLIGSEPRPNSDVSALVNDYHDLKDSTKFNELMEQLAEFTNKLYQPFPYFTKGEKPVGYYDLPEELRESFDGVKFQENPETGRTLIIGYNEAIGLIAFDIDLERELDGVPENYTMQLKTEAKVQVVAPDVIKETLFLIRAIILIGNEERDINIKRNVPLLFCQLKI